ncbi:MAG: CoA transferase [Lautropia sp.]
MTVTATRVARECLGAAGAPAPSVDTVFTGSGALASAFPVTDLAAGSVAAAGGALVSLIGQAHGVGASLRVDRRLASFWFQSSIRPVGWALPPVWDAIAGDYPCRDGWIRLHTNAASHRAAARRVLGAHDDRASIAGVVAGWDAAALEDAIVAAGGCAARMCSVNEWRAHPQGAAVAGEPLVHVDVGDAAKAPAWPVPRQRPLDGIRVLDLTRVLAGPVATRFLAGYGADVLRIDPPWWDEPAIAPEVTLGKRCARLDLREPVDRACFESLLAGADVLLHGYRPGALDALGYGPKARRRISPGLVDVSLDAYGWTGPWATRRGFDSLVQMSSGIAHEGMRWSGADAPTPLPAQALDHATGYLLAACAIAGLGRRVADGRPTTCRVSLARTAGLLLGLPREPQDAPLAPPGAADVVPAPEVTPWGDASRLLPPLEIDGTPCRWSRGAARLGGDPAGWAERALACKARV